MSIFICTNISEFENKIGALAGSICVITGRSMMSAEQIIHLEEVIHGVNTTPIEASFAHHSNITSQIKLFFKEVARFDPKWCWSFSAGVPLSVPGFRDIQQVFSLLAVGEQQDVVALVPDSRLRSLIHRLLQKKRMRWPFLGFPGWRAWLKMFRSLLRSLLNRSPCEMDVATVLFTLKHGDTVHKKDAYFGELVEHLEHTVLTVYLAAGKAVSLPRSETFLPIETFIRMSDVFCAFGASVRDGFKRLPPVFIHGYDFSPVLFYLQKNEQKIGENFVNHLLSYAFARLNRSLAPKVVCYPFESRSWERRLVTCCRQNNACKTVGYQHSSITPRHLAFQMEDSSEIPQWLPDRVITVGDITNQWLLDNMPIIAPRLAVAGSLRRLSSSLEMPVKAAVLVAISSSRDEALALMNYVKEATKQSSLKFIIRTHPTIPVDDLFACFHWPDQVELSTGYTLKEDLERVSFVAYASSTVAIEGMLFGRLPIFLDVGDLPKGDPILGSPDFWTEVNLPSQLGPCLEDLADLKAERLLEKQQLAIDYAETYLKLMDEKSWRLFNHELFLLDKESS